MTSTSFNQTYNNVNIKTQASLINNVYERLASTSDISSPRVLQSPRCHSSFSPRKNSQKPINTPLMQYKKNAKAHEK